MTLTLTPMAARRHRRLYDLARRLTPAGWMAALGIACAGMAVLALTVS